MKKLTITSNHSTVAIVAYIPVLHQGYLNFFKKYPEVRTLYLIGKEYTKEFRSLEKDIRALPTEMMVRLLRALEFFEEVEILNDQVVMKLESSSTQLIFPYEDISEFVAEALFPEKDIIFEPIFLRWDKKRTLGVQEVIEDQQVSSKEFDQQMMEVADEIGNKSTDWWRQVGAVIVKDGKILNQWKNIHVPYDYQQYVDGDPRANFSSGEHFELSSSLHAESACIADAAKRGVSLNGSEMYSTTFPCPVCAKLIAYSGIKKLYYVDGYSLLDGEDVLKSKGVEIVRVTR